MSSVVRPDRDHPTQASRRVARNTTYLALADGANKAMLFVFNMVAARHLGVTKFGVLSFALAFVTMLAVFTDMGLGAVSARDIARDPRSARRLVSNSLAMKLLASLVVILLIGVLVNLLGYPRTTVLVVYICSIFVLESAITSYYCWVFQGFERMELAALTRITQTAVLVVGALLLSRNSARVESYALLYVGAGLLSVLLAGTVASKWLITPRLSFSPKAWWELLRRSSPIGLTVMCTMFYYWNGTTFLSKLGGNEAVGNYSAAFRLAMGLAFGGFAFSGAVFPLLSRLFVADRQRLSQAMELALRYMSLLALPLAAFGSALSPQITSVVFGSGYEGSAAVLRVVAWWASLACLNSLLSNYLMGADKASVVTAQAGISLGVNIVGNVLLIPRWGAVGAAASIVCAEAVGCVCLFAQQLRTPEGVRFPQYAKVLLRLMTALVPAVIVILAVVRWNLPAAVGLAVAVYAVMLVATRGIGRGDFAFLSAVLKRGSD
ncbi:flippase [candidate division WOR-3 bacterium]|nr:flippase [candidate division WOR-3 bacterium]